MYVFVQPPAPARPFFVPIDAGTTTNTELLIEALRDVYAGTQLVVIGREARDACAVIPELSMDAEVEVLVGGLTALIERWCAEDAAADAPARPAAHEFDGAEMMPVGGVLRALLAVVDSDAVTRWTACVAAALIDRARRTAGVRVLPTTRYRLLITASFVALKLCCDRAACTPRAFASRMLFRDAGALAAHERALLAALDYTLHVDADEAGALVQTVRDAYRARSRPHPSEPAGNSAAQRDLAPATGDGRCDAPAAGATACRFVGGSAAVRA